MNEQIQKLEEKIKELESSKVRGDVIVARAYAKIMEKLYELEDNYKIIFYDMGYVRNKIDKLFNLDKKPYKCPVCDGQGGTKISGTIDEECHSCDSKGIVWG